MDPALSELLADDPRDEVEAIIRLSQPGIAPAGVRLVTRFGTIATCRLPKSRIVETWADESVASLKAPRLVLPNPDVHLPAMARTSWMDQRRSPSIGATGRDVVVGIVDFGCDFAHPDFRHADGRTRLLALWDQGRYLNRTDNRYGYGAVYTQDMINRALATRDPYAALGYHPADFNLGAGGAHGTTVMGIAAGNGRAGGPTGVAPAAELVFVNLATRSTRGLATLGDSVTVLEAVDFIARIAGSRPWVINLSIGRHGGPHDGSTLVEQGLDAALMAAPGRAIVGSSGNYFEDRVHASGQLRPGESRTLVFEVDKADVTPNELEIWYSSLDTLIVEIRSPSEEATARVGLGQQASLVREGQEIGRIYHRAHDPNNHDHHVDVFLYPGAPRGAWFVTLIGEDVVDGHFHAWIERDAGCPGCQSQFQIEDADPSSTLGTICTGFRTIAVGAYNPHSPHLELAPFSSAGPTRDGRQKPDLVAPGVSILAARSAPHDPDPDTPLLTRKSGTSMAAPHVAGAIACMFEATGRPLWIAETRRLLLSSTRKAALSAESVHRIGSGYLDVERAVNAAAQAGNEPLTREQSSLLAIGQPHDVRNTHMKHYLRRAGDPFSRNVWPQESSAEAVLEQVGEAVEDQDDAGFGRELVQWIDRRISAGKSSYSSGQLLNDVVSWIEIGEALETRRRGNPARFAEQPKSYSHADATHSLGAYESVRPLLSQPDPPRWIEVTVADKSGKPISGEPYNLYLADGTIRTGTTDASGRIYATDVSAGSWGLDLPNLPSFALFE
jgi:subtilisin family serine protease